MLGLRRFVLIWWNVILSKCQMKLSVRLYFIPEVRVEWGQVSPEACPRKSSFCLILLAESSVQVSF